MNRKYTWKLFLIGVIINFVFHYFYLFLTGVILCLIGIVSLPCRAVGFACLTVDLFLSVVEQFQIRKAALTQSDNQELNELLDAFLDPNGPQTPDQIIQGKRPFSVPEEDDEQQFLQNLPVYRALRESIHEGMTLDEMIDAFREMCHISVGEPDDVLFETGTYGFTGKKQFLFSLVRQFRVWNDGEYVQLHLEVSYVPSFQTALLYRVKWGNPTDDAFFHGVKKSIAYRAVRKKPVARVDVRIERT
jgi:hypothetical protein